MDNPSIKFGLLGSALTILIDLVLALVSTEGYVMLSGYFAFAVIIVVMVLVSKSYLKANEGFASLGELFKANWLSYLIMGLLTNLFVFILVNYISPEIKDFTIEKTMEAMEKMSGFLGEEGAEKAMEELENNNPFSIGTITGGLVMKYALFAIPAVIIAAIFKKEKSPFA